MTLPSGLALGLAALLGVAMGPMAVLVVIPLLTLGALIRQSTHWRPIIAVAVVALVASARGELTPERSLSSNVESSQVAHVKVVGLPVAGGKSERVTVEVQEVGDGAGGWQDASGRVVVFLPEDVARISRGDESFMVWDVTPSASLDPGFRSFVRSQGGNGSASAFYVEVSKEGPTWSTALTGFRREVAASLQQVLPGDAGALASGVVTGDDSALSNEAADAFFRTGTSHITAVSGQNVALLLGVLGAVFRSTHKAMRILASVVMMLVVWSFVVMVGLEPPALRAAVVATLALGASMVGRRPDVLTLLSLTLGCMALWNPAVVSGIGFWLSAAASFALCSVIPTRGIGPGAAVAATVRGVFAANVATMPIILWGFGVWSPTSLLANVVIGPVMTLAFPAAYALALVAVIAPAMASFIAWIPAVGLDLTLSVVHRLAPLIGGLTLPASDPGVLLLIGMPCALAVLALGRDGARWSGLVQAQWDSGLAGMRALVSGAVAGLLALCILVVIAI